MALVATVGFALAARSLFEQKTNPSVGFEVLIPTQGPRATETDHWGNALVMQIDSKHVWSLNGRALSPADLKHVLEQKLCPRTQKLVLFDGSPDVGYGEAIQAIDTIESACPTHVAVITPEMKKSDSDRFYLKNARGQLR